MILTDTQLRETMRENIAPWDDALVNPSSIDLRLGDTIRRAYPAGWSEIIQLSAGDALLHGEFILAHTLETIRIPVGCVGMLFLKSTRGREGWEHSHAALFDAGFCGQPTLELSNLAPWPLALVPGLLIAQMVFMQCQPPERDYDVTGHYQHQIGPTKPWRE